MFKKLFSKFREEETQKNPINIPVDVSFSNERIGTMKSRQISSIELGKGKTYVVTPAGSGNQKGVVRQAATEVGFELKDSWGKDATSNALIKEYGCWSNSLYEVLNVGNVVIQRCSNKQYPDYGQVYIYTINQ